MPVKPFLAESLPREKLPEVLEKFRLMAVKAGFKEGEPYYLVTKRY